VPKKTVDPLDELMAGLAALAGRPATGEDRRIFQQYLQIFLRWNQVHRMTALDSAGDIVRDLFLDSLRFLALLPPRPLEVADIGAGGGIPGLPIRLADPSISLTLFESRRKRVSFLRTACRELRLADVTVKEGRAEELIREEPGLRGAFDVVVTRAVGPAGGLLPVALEYLRPGGLFIASGSPHASAQGSVEVVRVRVPGMRGARTFLRATKGSNVPRGT
jgi:16S rRNA (guanine527-N7)-methyltransferase